MEKHESMSFRKYHIYEDDEIQFTGSASEIADYLGYQTRWVHYLASNNRIIENDGRTIRFKELVVPYEPVEVEAEFAMYKNEEIVGYGTLEELAEKFNVKLTTMKYYAAPSARRRYGGRGTCLVELEDDSY